MELIIEKIFVIGSNGMAGHCITSYLQDLEEFEIYYSSRNEISPCVHHTFMDITDKTIVEKTMAKIKPKYVINCVGLLINECKKSPHNALITNSQFPHFLDDLSRFHNFQLIHISTDCVFDGKSGKYCEKCIPNATSIYGKSKSLGEIKNSKTLTIRTSIIGPELKASGTGLFHWFMQQQGTIEGYTHAYWTGVTTLELAKFIYFYISKNIPIRGIFHLSNSISISKHQLLIYFSRYFNRNLKVIKNSKIEVDKSLICTRTDYSYEVPSYQKMILEMNDWINTHKIFYPFYFQEKSITI